MQAFAAEIRLPPPPEKAELPGLFRIQAMPLEFSKYNDSAH